MTLLLLEDGHCLRDQALDVCGRISVNEKQDFRATSIETLAQASAQVTRMVSSLYRNGTRVALIGHLVQDLQARLFDGLDGVFVPDGADILQFSDRANPSKFA